MLYTIISEDIKDSGEKRASARQEHIARLRALTEEGRLLLP